MKSLFKLSGKACVAVVKLPPSSPRQVRGTLEGNTHRSIQAFYFNELLFDFDHVQLSICYHLALILKHCWLQTTDGIYFVIHVGVCFSPFLEVLIVPPSQILSHILLN